MAGSSEESPSELVKTFQILDNVAAILAMVLEGAEASNVTPAVAKLHARFQRCESVLDNLPGGDMSKDEQEEKIKSLRESIARRRQLASKYASLAVLHQIAESGTPGIGAGSIGMASATPNSLPGSAGTFQGGMSQGMDFTPGGPGMLSANTDHLFFGVGGSMGQGHMAQTGLTPTPTNVNPGDKSSRGKGLDPMEL